MVDEIRKRVKAFFSWWVTPIRPLGRTERRPDRPWTLLPSTIVIVFLDWLYFAVFVSYSKIPNKPVFWSALVAWAVPPILELWKYRDAPELRVRNVTGNMFIGIAIVGLVVVVLWSSFDFLPPIGLAAMPAVLTGTLVGGIFVFISKHYNHQA